MDGVNDSLALDVVDVGISVDSCINDEVHVGGGREQRDLRERRGWWREKQNMDLGETEHSIVYLLFLVYVFFNIKQSIILVEYTCSSAKRNVPRDFIFFRRLAK